MSGEIISPHVMWVILCSFLVAMMQAGFTCLESGFVRSKNSINVAVKNLMDFCITCTVYTLVGFSIMFGDSVNGVFGVIGSEHITSGNVQSITFYIFQLMFAGTATTIISGAVTERMSFFGYIVITVIIATLIYPVCGHWIWAQSSAGTSGGWLAELGFIDFAGSTVVHSVAGWCALAAVIVIGPRHGRYGKGGKFIEGHNLPISVLGVFLLWVGFFGFNGGSTLEINEKVPLIIANTALSGATGGLAAMIVSWSIYRIPRVEHLINGTVAGLVAICAGCHLFSEIDSMIVGLVAGALCVLAMNVLDRMHIDDVIGAVPGHMVAGVWGTLAVAFFAPVDAFLYETTRVGQFGIQLIGAAACGVYSFTVLYLIMKALGIKVRFRVTAESERIGLNISEHGATTSLLELISQMDLQAKSGDFAKPVDIEPETEAGHIAMFYNSVLEKFHVESTRRQQAVDNLYKLANYDALTELVNRRYFFDLLGRAVSRSKRAGTKLAVLFIDLDGFKGVNDTLGHEAGDELLIKVSERIQDSIRESDIIGRIGGDEFCVFLENIAGNKAVEQVVKKILKEVSQTYQLKAARANIGASVGIVVFDPLIQESATPEELVNRADKAMYVVKQSGKGSFGFYSAGS